jgi:hypothetical protein
MKHHTQLRAALSPHLAVLNKCRLDNTVAMILGLVSCLTVNMAAIALAINDGSTHYESTYRKCQRFIAEFDIPQKLIAQAILAILALEKYILIMDRTEWKFGVVWINFLTVSISYKGVAVPIAWINLNKKGNSNFFERTVVFHRAMLLIPAHKVIAFTADREFCDKKFIHYLERYHVTFVLRPQRGYLITYKGETKSFESLFSGIHLGEIRHLAKKGNFWGHKVYVCCVGLEKGDLLIVVSNKVSKKLLERYATRWNIESMHKALKTHGFNLEDTHLKAPERLERLFGLVCLAFVWACVAGTWAIKQGLGARNRVLKDGYSLYSTFTMGLHLLIKVVRDGEYEGRVQDDVFRLLS